MALLVRRLVHLKEEVCTSVEQGMRHGAGQHVYLGVNTPSVCLQTIAFRRVASQPMPDHHAINESPCCMHCPGAAEPH